MSRIRVFFKACFALLCFFWTTQAFPEVSFLAKLDHCEIYWLRGELELSSLSSGSDAVTPVRRAAWARAPIPSVRGAGRRAQGLPSLAVCLTGDVAGLWSPPQAGFGAACAPPRGGRAG